jgi:hypothetical protein
VISLDRQRRWYLSFDIDLTRLPVKSKALKGLFSVVNMLKFPAPALEFKRTGLRVYPVYY